MSDLSDYVRTTRHSKLDQTRIERTLADEVNAREEALKTIYAIASDQLGMHMRNRDDLGTYSRVVAILNECERVIGRKR